MSAENVYMASILALGFFAQWLAWRLRLPSLLLLIGLGLAVGEVARSLGHDPATMIETPVLLAGISLAVAVILFEGGMSLRLGDLSETKTAVFRLVTVAIFVTWVLAALACWFFLKLPIEVCVLQGAILVVSGPTVIAPLLRHIRPTGRIDAVVRWEGIVNDPIGAVLAVLVFEAIAVLAANGGGAKVWEELSLELGLNLIGTALIGVAIGGVTAVILIQSLKRFWVPDFLHVMFFLAAVIASFSTANALAHESGLVAVTVLGIALANQKVVAVKHVVEFKEHLGVILVSALFMVLASRMGLNDLLALGIPGLLFLASLLFVVRPAAVFLSTWNTGLNLPEKVFLTFLAPRGIVAVAVTSVFALRLAERVPSLQAAAEQMVPITFLVIIGTVGFYGLLAAPLARWLGLANAKPQGLLFVGASPWVRSMAKALHEEGFKVLLVDTNRRNLMAARMEGLPTLAGNVLSDYVHNNSDLHGLGRLLAMTSNDEVNALAALEFQDVFSRAEVYHLVSDADRNQRQLTPQHLQGRLLFNAQATFSNLEQRFADGAQIKKTPLTPEFGYPEYQQIYGDNAWPLFRIIGRNQLAVCAIDQGGIPKSGETLVALVAPKSLSESAGSAETAATAPAANAHGNQRAAGADAPSTTN